MIDQRQIATQILTTDHSNRRIAARCNCAHSTVSRYRSALQHVHATAADLAKLSDADLADLFAVKGRPPRRDFIEPNWLHAEALLRRKGVDRHILWSDYASEIPAEAAMSYREFCRRLAKHKKRYGLVMRQEHLAGEKLFVDFMGGRPQWADPVTGELKFAEVFVACLGASNYVYAEAVPTQRVSDWVTVHVNALEALGGAPEVFVPDNLKAAVLGRPRGEPPILNPAYQALAEHYGVVIEPARPAHPQDKPAAELAVKFVHKALAASLRKRVFFSIAELNIELKKIVAILNAKRFAKEPEHSRLSLFELIDKPALAPLPAMPFEYEQFHVGITIGADYHVRFDRVAYSVPHVLIGETVDVRAKRGAVEIWRCGQRVAVHARAANGVRRVTDPSHMPARHRAWRDAEGDMMSWTLSYGPNAISVAEHISTSSEAKYTIRRRLKSLRELARASGHERFEEACGRAIAIGGLDPTTIQNLLRRGLGHVPLDEAREAPPPRNHSNIRGKDYFKGGDHQ